jgi:3'-5' exoribonuclease
MKDLFIADFSRLEENRTFDCVYLVLAKQHRTTKAGKAYLSLTLGDNSGQIEARVWEPGDSRISPEFDRGDAVKVRGAVTKFEGVLQLKVDAVRPLQASEFDRMDLLPRTTADVGELWTKLEAAVDSLSNPDLRLLVGTMLADPAVHGAFGEAPAAKQLHHAWLGGLLEHVVSLVGLANRVVPHYPLVDRDLVLTGVILHDIGKIKELSWGTGFEYTLEGQLLGHIQIGASMIEKVIDGLPGFPPKLKTLVMHLILSHHGKLEFGSPKLPMIPEALMLNFLDDMDAKMQTVATEFERAARQGKGPGEMTERIWALDQRTMLNTKAWLQAD